MNLFLPFKIRHAVFATFSLWMITISTPANATTLVATNLAQLSESAESAFVIKIESVETSSSSDGKSFDVVRGIIIDPIFGDIKTSETISWNQFRLGVNVALPSMPTYEIGKEYLIFLTGPGRGTGFKSPVGLGQGAFSVIRNSKTGEAFARNAYMNSTLTSGLNLDAIATDIVARNPQTRSISLRKKQEKADILKLKLKGRAVGNSLNALKKAAQFFHNKKLRGGNSSSEYHTTSPLRVLR